MAIQIIDGFQVNTALPIDNRIVASGSAARNDIPYKYHGLRVFDISDSIPYVWTGSSWVSENASGIAGSGTTDYFPLYTSSNVVSSSLLYQSGGVIKTGDDGGGSDLIEIYPYLGTVTVQGGFIGPGTYINDLNASNISSGSLAINRITNGSTGYVLTGGLTSPTYVNPNQLTTGTSSNSVSSVINNTTVTNATHYLTFVSTGAWGSVPGATSSIRANSTDLSYNPSTKILTTATISTTFLKTSMGSTVSPAIAFSTDTNTGIYSPLADNLALVTAGVERFRVRSGGASDFEFKSLTGIKKVGLSVYDSGYTTLTLSPTTTTSLDILGFSSGLYVYGPFGASGAKTFKISHPHPSKSENYDLVHASVESSRIENLYRGKVELSNGLATINLDTHSNMTDGTFVLFNRDPFVMTTSEDSFIRVRGSVSGNILTIESETPSNDSVNWLVICERCDSDIINGFNTDEDGKLITEILKSQKN